MTQTSRSPLEEAAERVGDRWTLLIVAALLEGPRRFSDLSDSLPGIAPNILSQRLKHLETESVIVARPYSQRPLRLAYELTASGAGLAGALRLLEGWAAASKGGGTPRHDLCGTPLEARWYCPTCARPAGDGADEDLRFL